MKITSKVIVSAIVIVFAISGCGVSYGIVSHKDADHGFNEITAENPDANEVFPRGKGYTLTDKQASQYQLPEKSSQDINLNDKMKLSQDGHQDPFNSQSRNGNRKIKLPSNPGGNTGDFVTLSVEKPTLTNKSVQLEKGTDQQFIVKAINFKTKKPVANAKVEVKYGKNVVSGAPTKLNDNGEVSFTITVADHDADVVVKVDKTKSTRESITTIHVNVSKTPKISMRSDCSKAVSGLELDLSKSYTVKDEDTTYRSLILGVLKENQYGTNRSGNIRYISGFDLDTELRLTDSVMDDIISKYPEMELTKDDFLPISISDGTVNNINKITTSKGDVSVNLKWRVVDKDGKDVDLSKSVKKDSLPSLKLVYEYIK